MGMHEGVAAALEPQAAPSKVADGQHASLAEALLAFQAEAPTLCKETDNTYYKSKYVSLDSIVETIQPLLAKHGLVWSALPCFGPNGEPALRYRLTHAVTGYAYTDVMPLLVQKPDPQGMGSALTYARRYSLTAVLNLVADEDDDGNGASRRQANGGARSEAPRPTAAPVQDTERPASAKQRGMLNARAAEADLAPSDFANLILTAAGQELRDFESQDAAQQWLKRSLDRLPARLVDPVLKQIEKTALS